MNFVERLNEMPLPEEIEREKERHLQEKGFLRDLHESHEIIQRVCEHYRTVKEAKGFLVHRSYSCGESDYEFDTTIGFVNSLYGEIEFPNEKQIDFLTYTSDTYEAEKSFRKYTNNTTEYYLKMNNEDYWHRNCYASNILTISCSC